MKIKEVCSRTGLTDRAVRFYIENGLLFPSHTENYAGRRTYIFSENDVSVLKQISTLRRYDFSIESIKELLLPEGDVQRILEEHISLLEEKSRNDIAKLESLVNSLNESPWTPEELCDSLNTSDVKPVTVEENLPDEKFLEKKKHNSIIISAVFGIAIIVLFVLAIILTKNNYMNGTVLSYFFAAEGLLGYYVIKNVFQYFKPQHYFIPYLIIVLIIYLIGTFSRYF